MKVLIVAKTRRGAGACVGGITDAGRSVRLIPSDATTNERAGLEYAVGEVREIDAVPDEQIVPPHVENIIVRRAWRVKRSKNLESAIRRFMPPVCGDRSRSLTAWCKARRAERSISRSARDSPVAARYSGCRTSRCNSTTKANASATVTQRATADARSLSWGFKSRWK